MLNEDTVLIAYQDGVVITKEEAVNDYKVYDEFTQRKRVKKLIISGKFTQITSEAREYIQEENKKRSHVIIAEAIVTHSMYQKILGNFYLNIVKRKYPMRIFSDIEEAKVWLENVDESKPVKQSMIS